MAETVILPYELWMLEDIAALERLCFSTPWSKESLREVGESEDHVFYVLTGGNGLSREILGFGCVSVMLDEAELLNIAVSPAHRKMGLGQLLLSALFDEAARRGAQRFFLEVRESNLPALKLYLRNGFVAVGRRKRYYTNPTEDAVIMLREHTSDSEIN